MLNDKGKLSFDDRISNHLDKELLVKFHVLRGEDHSDDIRIYHLLNHTPSLADVYFHLYRKMIDDPDMRISKRELILWGKENPRPKSRPGDKHLYTDTKYYLLGLIIENITEKAFQEVLHERL